MIAAAIVPLVMDLIANAQPSGYIFPHSEDLFYSNNPGGLSLSGGLGCLPQNRQVEGGAWAGRPS